MHGYVCTGTRAEIQRIYADAATPQTLLELSHESTAHPRIQPPDHQAGQTYSDVHDTHGHPPQVIANRNRVESIQISSEPIHALLYSVSVHPRHPAQRSFRNAFCKRREPGLQNSNTKKTPPPPTQPAENAQRAGHGAARSKSAKKPNAEPIECPKPRCNGEDSGCPKLQCFVTVFFKYDK